MAIVRNIQNNLAYEYIGDNVFKNIISQKEGFVDDETARKVFKINAEATQIISEYPMVAEMIKVLELKFDNQKT